ncbi:4-aminobutyrate--2-oxoglutarate transaminase [Salinicola rhizosphaerae]|uniref:4-aminobutyrate transaminase n=1 Tax=Salinicola rhizosphaerae TaxID=1443141 RepID=A0ABQ3DVP3_9GAMM|nr:4-aminobutyrate--2-oxoglutarate transaminase [Salinicola rhizosphaerae]GHB17143.1 4-aminobutyrate transaminase [Salinicola rhizosphaerae]
MSTNAEWGERRQAATARGVGVKFDLYVDRAENAEIWDIEGNRYIDFMSGVAVNNVGHRHPKVVEAIKAQLDSAIHTAYHNSPYTSYITLAERLNASMPGEHAKKTIFFSTGAEAVENAVKIARTYTKRRAVIAFSGAFHGRTSLGIALTGKAMPFRKDVGPFPGEIYHSTFPNALHGISAERAIEDLKRVMKTEVDPQDVAAILFEPIQGEGGFVPAPPAFVEALRAICDEHGIVLIADEIQTGFGRTGKLFAMEHYGVSADLTTLAKSLGGGVPLSAVCGRAEMLDAPAPAAMGGTYAGNPLGIAAGHAVLDVIEEEQLVERSNQLGERLAARLEQLKSRVPQIAEVRGKGSMRAIEFLDETGKPAPELALAVLRTAKTQGLLVLACGFYGNVIRFLHPLTISESLLDEGLDVLERVVEKVCQVQERVEA